MSDTIRTPISSLLVIKQDKCDQSIEKLSLPHKSVPSSNGYIFAWPWVIKLSMIKKLKWPSSILFYGFKENLAIHCTRVNFNTGQEKLLISILTFLKRKNSGVQTAPKARATSCDCKKEWNIKHAVYIKSITNSDLCNKRAEGVANLELNLSQLLFLLKRKLASSIIQVNKHSKNITHAWAS